VPAPRITGFTKRRTSSISPCRSNGGGDGGTAHVRVEPRLRLEPGAILCRPRVQQPTSSAASDHPEIDLNTFRSHGHFLVLHLRDADTQLVAGLDEV
jgi:hypothetical protein